MGWGAASHGPLSLKPRRWLLWVTAETAWITGRQVLKGVVPAVWNTEAPQARHQQHFPQLWSGDSGGSNLPLMLHLKGIMSQLSLGAPF